MSVDLRARHYWVVADYREYYILQADGRLKPASYDGNANLNFNQFNIDLTYIWNFAPGSQISVMWKNAINTNCNQVQYGYLDDLGRTISSPAANSFSIRILYYLDALYFKKKKSIS